VTGQSAQGRFPPASRIRKRLEFEAAQNGGRRATTAHFVFLLYARSHTNAPPRLGIVASRKIGNAVVRNRAKRLVREAFRSARDLFVSGIDVVVIVRRPLEKQKLGDVVTEWRGAASIVQKRSAEAVGDYSRRDPAANDRGASA
jgi:ribonuclease P protein component